NFTGNNLTINKATVSVTANAQSKIYGVNDPTLTYSSTGLVNATVDGVVLNDSLSGALNRAQFGTIAGEQVGSFAISQGTLVASSNYNPISFTGNNLTINKATVSVTANAQSKIYGVNDPTLTYSSTGLVNATVDGVVLNDSLSGALSRAQFGTIAGEQVGSFAISQGNLSASSNYNPISFTGSNLTINKATVSVTADAQSKIYGVNDPTLTYSSTGLVNATVDGVVLNDSFSGALSRAQFGTIAGEQVGSFAISQGNLSASSNYNPISFTGSNLTINKATVSVTADAQTKIYGVNDPTLTYSSTGLVNATVDGVVLNDSLSGALSRAQFGTIAGEQVGSFAISQGTLAASSNYNP